MFSLADGLAAVYVAQGLIRLETWKGEAMKVTQTSRDKKKRGQEIQATQNKPTI